MVNHGFNKPMTSTKAAPSGNDPIKREPGGYPYMPLNLVMKVADAVKDLGGARSAISKSLLAKQLGDSERAPAFSQKITAAKCFGLIDGHGAYSLTELARRYYFPTTESDKSLAYLEIFSAPPAFKELLRKFDGDKLPSREILGNILHREIGVPESWKDRMASFFINSAQLVGAIDGQGFLRHKAASHSSVERDPEAVNPPSPDSPPPRTPMKTPPAPLPVAFSANTNSWAFSYKGQTVTLITPAELEQVLWEKLNGYVQLLKPVTEDKPPT